MAPSAATEQSISVVLDAEIMTDPDTGQPMLVAGTSHDQGDAREITAAQLRQETAAVRDGLGKADALADRFERLTQNPEAPRTWTFINMHTDEPVTVRCMPGCEADHSDMLAGPRDPEDFWCFTNSTNATLPVNVDGDPEHFRILTVMTSTIPFSPVIANRVPHAAIEVLDDHWIDSLDPDGLETVINTLAARVTALRAVHTHLVQVRAQYMGRS